MTFQQKPKTQKFTRTEPLSDFGHIDTKKVGKLLQWGKKHDRARNFKSGSTPRTILQTILADAAATERNIKNREAGFLSVGSMALDVQMSRLDIMISELTAAGEFDKTGVSQITKFKGIADREAMDRMTVAVDLLRLVRGGKNWNIRRKLVFFRAGGASIEECKRLLSPNRSKKYSRQYVHKLLISTYGEIMFGLDKELDIGRTDKEFFLRVD